MEEMYDSGQSNYMCSECGRSYKTDGWFKKHLAKEHNWQFTEENFEESKQDRIAIYRSSFMKCALILRDTNDAYKLGDGDRILRNSKFEMLCADVGKHTKYKLWLFRFIAYCISILSQKQALEYLWNCTVNTAGGVAKNIPNDNLVEILVQSIKKKISQQGANATFSSARKAALSSQVQNAIRDNLSHECMVKHTGKTRPTVNKSSDIRLIVAELGRPDSSVGSVFGFCLAIYLCRAGSNPTSDASKKNRLLKKYINGSCIGMYQMVWLSPSGRGGFTGYFPAERRELLWLSPTN